MKPRPAKRRIVRWSWQALRQAAGAAASTPAPEAIAFKLDLGRSLARRNVRTPAAAIPHTLRLGIVGFGFGVKIVAGKAGPTRCVRVYVRRKQAERALAPRARVPKTINGLPTDVIELPRVRPNTAFGGDYVGFGQVATGTFGCVVKREGAYFILSNNHVLANCNAGKAGDPIRWYDPATGVPAPIATLDAYVKLDFSAGGKNLMDAALARLLDPAHVSPQIQGIGRIAPGVVPPYAGQRVTKYGATTRLTTGVIEGYHEDFPLTYGDQTAIFEGQLAVKSVGMTFADDGDSGSLVLTEDTHQPVGLHFANDLLAGLNFCTPIQTVLGAFQATLVT